jgi:pyruvate dehydrogenase E2 component (dihydrolipoamide acetyltransferase)
VAEVQLPQLGESVTEGVITRWLVAVGDTVSVDQPIVEISTDKVDTEIPSPVAGTVTELRAAVDDTIEVGATLAVITEGATQSTPTAAPAPAASAPAASAPAPTPAPAAPAPTPAPAAPAPAPAPAAPAPAAPAPTARPAASSAGVVAAPLVRRLLADAGLSPADVVGSGPGGRVTRADAERAIASGARPAAPVTAAAAAAPAAPIAPPPAPPVAAGGRPRPEASPITIDFAGQREVVQPLSRIRGLIASSMMTSLQTTAQLTAGIEIDMSRVMGLRAHAKDAFKATHGVSLSPFAMAARAVCRVLPRHPALNASIDTEASTVTYHGHINLGIAVDTERGLLVPNVKDAQALDVVGMATTIADLAARSRGRQLSPDDISGGTFTLTNTGSRGTLFDTPILNPPEAAILAVCAIERRPVVVADALGESIAIRWMSYFCLTYDHRLVDGADAARFLSDLKWELEEGDLGAELGLPA